MKRIATIICLSLSGLIILDSFNAGHALVMFLLAGHLPGTSMVISAEQMLVLFAILGGFVVGRLVNRLIFTLSGRLRLQAQT